MHSDSRLCHRQQVKHPFWYFEWPLPSTFTKKKERTGSLFAKKVFFSIILLTLFSDQSPKYLIEMFVPEKPWEKQAKLYFSVPWSKRFISFLSRVKDRKTMFLIYY